MLHEHAECIATINGRRRRLRVGWSFALALLLLAACTRPGTDAETAPAPEAQEPAAAALARGRTLYDANCVQCHGGASGGAMMDIPPPHNANGHTWHHPDCQLIDIILNGSGQMGEMMRRMHGAGEDTPRMPAFEGRLSQDDARDILAYIKTWWSEEQRRAQARNTAGQCG